MTLYRAEDLQTYAAALLAGGGFSPAHAEQTARVLVWANARGADSHGVLRIPRYVEMVEEGKINPVAAPEVKISNGAVSILEADSAPGASSMLVAMDEAVEIASRLGIGWCSARNITHAGAVGYYTMQAARRGYVGIVMTASGPLMAYHGARVSGVSTNPISIAVPAEGNPLLLDMSTSTVALGKIMAAKDASRPVPHGWGIDADGEPATDPHKIATLTPLGGPKGSGLSLMIEVLASVLVSNPVISEALSGRSATMNGLAMALNIQAFADADVFARQIAELVVSIKGLPAARGTEAILMPGERGFAMADQRSRDGIPLAKGTLKRLAELAERLGVPEPVPLRPADETRPAAL
jgi:ureidoglycolate dehydrogenase (NAD+)